MRATKIYKNVVLTTTLLITSYFTVMAQMDKNHKVEKTEAEWKSILSAMEYNILREQGTEMAFTGQYWDHKEEGTYLCKGCASPLFGSDTKFKSGTGWPSFYMPMGDTSITEKPDHKYGWNRTEVVCATCGGHLGHVFNDGPKPTGLRYCINSAALDFKKE
jgi:peptide-methionine (R)-S-oxide reductase